MRLPDSVQEIADVIGREQALLLVGQLPKAYSKDKRYPGAMNSTLVMYVPTVARLGVMHPFVKVLGWNDAVKLCKAFGGEIMYPANCACIHRKFRDDNILRMVAEGVKKAIVADQMGVSERHVRNLVRAVGVGLENPPEGRQEAANDNRQIQQMATA